MLRIFGRFGASHVSFQSSANLHAIRTRYNSLAGCRFDQFHFNRMICMPKWSIYFLLRREFIVSIAIVLYCRQFAANGHKLFRFQYNRSIAFNANALPNAKHINCQPDHSQNIKHILALCRRLANNLCVIYTFVKVSIGCFVSGLSRQFTLPEREAEQAEMKQFSPGNVIESQ